MSLTPSAAALRTLIRTGWPNLRIDDGIACRKIAGSDRWSQHAYGNALDMYGTHAELEDLYQALQLIPTATEICYHHRGGCTTPHTDHLHVDALPRMRGTPACAKGQPPADNPAEPSTASVAAGVAANAATAALGPLGGLITAGAKTGIDLAGEAAPVVTGETTLGEAVGGAVARNLAPPDIIQRSGLILLGLVLLIGGGALIFRQVTPAGQLTKLLNAPPA